MPVHAKVLAGMLALNVLSSAVPLLQGAEPRAMIGVVIPVLMLWGFLKGSEGVRSLLLFGAAISAVLGGVGLLIAVPLVATGGTLGMLALTNAALSVTVGLYMLWALRTHDVTEWMLNRSLGGALDDE
ncbi:MAG: hypothetical protein AAF721_37590 [Myxococcota bacterium]